ncbi:MAG: ATP phosphoribosyltransferase [Clostridia bacterium]|nr:ATP phosphoribosyltransferase [Clostridia bacterium]
MIKNFIPEGVSDLGYDEFEQISKLEKAVLNVFKNEGYRQIKTPAFEYYDLFSEADNSLETKDMYKLIDNNGQLMVLRPDATIPIARMMATHYKESDGDVKLMYLTDVFRRADFRAGEKREFKQAGIEYFGSASPQIDANLILTAEKAVSAACVGEIKIELGDVDYFNGFLKELMKDERLHSVDTRLRLKELVESKNIPGLKRFAEEFDVNESLTSVLLEIPLLYGNIDEVCDRADKLAMNPEMKAAVENIRRIYSETGKKNITADMGLINTLEYYSGMIFKIYIKNTGVIAGSGGRYDALMQKFGKKIPAVGFGLNIDVLYDSEKKSDVDESSVLTIALGKGRLADITIDNLKKAGITFPEYSKDSRKLIFNDSTGKYRIVFVKAVDVGIYVEKGACDIGVIGKDTLLESGSDVFEMIDLGYGKCKFSVAAPEGFRYDPKKKLIVATKYPRVAKSHFAKYGRSIEIIKINGSVELAPIVGLSDVIVDIVETGTTLRENGLEVVEDITDISARLIVNRASLKTKEKMVSEFMSTVREAAENGK